MRTLVFGGGGTAGHVTPSLAVFDVLEARGWNFLYAGSSAGIEARLVGREGIPFQPISVGKWQRKRLLANLKTPMKVVRGVFDAMQVLRRARADVVFTTGGYVGLPLIVAARLLGIPSLVHECDLTPGLAVRLAFPFATRFSCSFSTTRDALPRRAVHTGPPLRKYMTALREAREVSNTLVVFGGSLGSVAINTAVRAAVRELTARYEVVHVCGRGNIDQSLQHVEGYQQLEYVDDLPQLLARARAVVARAGSSSLWELVQLRVPHVVVPLPLSVSRGDQLANAAYFEQHGTTLVLQQSDLSAATLLEALVRVTAHAQQHIAAMKRMEVGAGAERVAALLECLAEG